MRRRERRRRVVGSADLIADIGERRVAEIVPLHAKLAAGLTIDFDEAHLQHHLLLLHHLYGVDDAVRIGRKLPRHHHGLVERGGIRHGTGQHDAAVDRRHLDAAVGELRDLRCEKRNVVGHFNVENADRLLVGAIHRDARRADLLAENGQRAVGQRADIGHRRIADHDIGEALLGVHVLRLAERDRYHRSSRRARQRDVLLSMRRDRQRRHGGHQHRRERGAAAPFQRADDRGPVPMKPAPAGDAILVLILAVHVGLPAAACCPRTSSHFTLPFRSPPNLHSCAMCCAESAAEGAFPSFFLSCSTGTLY